MWAVYARMLPGVNQQAGCRRILAVMAVACLPFLSAIVGCMTPSRSTARSRPSGAIQSSLPHLLTVAYDVEPMMVGKGHETSFDAIRHDFRSIAELGFESVMLRYVDTRDRRAILDIARENGLSAGLCDLAVQHYVRTAVRSGGGRGDAVPVPQIPSDVISHQAFTILVVESSSSSRSLERCEDVCSRAGRGGPAAGRKGWWRAP